MEFLNPSKILDSLSLRENFIAADFGCGSGGWAIPLAKKLENGKVYAIDILEEPLSVLRGAARLAKVFNIESIRFDIESESELPVISQNSIDVVLMTNLLFQTDNRERVFSQAKRILKNDGLILVIDWKLDAPLGPKEGRISAEEVKELAIKSGLKLKKEFEAGAYHYGLVFEKI